MVQVSSLPGDPSSGCWARHNGKRAVVRKLLPGANRYKVQMLETEDGTAERETTVLLARGQFIFVSRASNM